MFKTLFKILSKYRGINRKGSGDVCCLLHYVHYLYIPLSTQTAETTSPKPFSSIPLFMKCVHNVHNSTVVSKFFLGFVVLFSLFLAFSKLKKVFKKYISIKLNIRNMSSVIMLKHIIIHKKGLVLSNKTCLKRLILGLLE